MNAKGLAYDARALRLAIHDNKPAAIAHNQLGMLYLAAAQINVSVATSQKDHYLRPKDPPALALVCKEQADAAALYILQNMKFYANCQTVKADVSF